MIDEKAPEEQTEEPTGFVPPDYQPILLPDTAMSAHQAKAVPDVGRTGAPSLR